MNNQQTKQNSYTSEFKESAVKLALESDQPIAQTARDLGVNQNTIHTWISTVGWGDDRNPNIFGTTKPCWGSSLNPIYSNQSD